MKIPDFSIASKQHSQQQFIILKILKTTIAPSKEEPA
jgi:hypothetical protein